MEFAKTLETDKQRSQSGDSVSPISKLRSVTSAGSPVVPAFQPDLRVIEVMPEGMIVTDEAGRIMYANPPEELTFGYARGELIGMHLADLSGYPDEEIDRHIGEVFSELHSNGIWSGEWLNKSKEGSRFYSTATMNTAELDGRVCFVRTHQSGTCKSDLQAAAYHFAALVESSDDAIISKDLNGIITSWNSSAERMFGFSAGEAIGRPITMLAAPGREDEMPKILERIRKGESVKHFETVRRRKN